MENQIIGRVEELQIFKSVLTAKESEMIAVTGRRRIGKTYIITEAFKNNMAFDLIGTQNGPLKEQLANFGDQLQFYSSSAFTIKPPNSWREAFSMLRNYLEVEKRKEKKVLFFDELPWLAGQKSGFVEALSYFWNSWASKNNFVVVICGSAASWMIEKVINNKGGLHNRITKHIHLEPFTLTETDQFLKSRNVYYDKYQVVQLYMAVGGVPHYLKEIDASKSVIQNINKICFNKNGFLYNEFYRLYKSLFNNAENHENIVRALMKKKAGMTRNELIENTVLVNGGGLTKVLKELILSGFVKEIYPFGKSKKEKLFRLTDEYSLFYLEFIEKNKGESTYTWNLLSQSHAYRAWSGYAFEGLCMSHIEKIKEKLGISGIFTSVSSFYNKGNIDRKGVQIDLLLDRNDQTVNLFELKFHNKPLEITEELVAELRQKSWLFQEITKTKKDIKWVIISTFGVKENKTDLISNCLSAEDLF